MDASRLIECARVVALSSSGIIGPSGRVVRVGAVLAYKNRVIAARPNSAKTHRPLFRFDPYATLHAERAVILAAGFDNCPGLTLAVARVLRNGDNALAKPCNECQDLIDFVGIKRVFFTDATGSIADYRV